MQPPSYDEWHMTELAFEAKYPAAWPHIESSLVRTAFMDES